MKGGGQAGEEVTATVFQELKERESRKCNIIIHNLKEPDKKIKESEERIEKDKNSFDELCKVIEADVDMSSLRFAKRLGAVHEDGSARPLLVGFQTTEQCQNVLDKTPGLSELEERWSQIHVVRDLTKLQRKEEKDLRDDLVKRNGELQGADAENWIWKVVGRRGERKLVKVAREKEG